MIRKLKSGEYRLYSRKPDPKTGKRRNLGTFATRAAAEPTLLSGGSPQLPKGHGHALVQAWIATP